MHTYKLNIPGKIELIEEKVDDVVDVIPPDPVDDDPVAVDVKSVAPCTTDLNIDMICICICIYIYISYKDRILLILILLLLLLRMRLFLFVDCCEKKSSYRMG